MNRSSPVINIEVTGTRGSAPRDAGTVMQVTQDTTVHTIGGGALEYRAIRTARRMLADGLAEHHETIPLGPGLGQCCGGTVTLRFSTSRSGGDPFPVVPDVILPVPATPLQLWVWGAGHVGRAVISHAPRATFDITWIDTSIDRFPAHVPPRIVTVPATDMPRLVPRAPAQAHHLIFTYSHDIDLALCAALLRHTTASIGLIGSATKWARFSKRLKAAGLDPAPVTCPIGDKTLGKRPDEIALGTLRALLCDSQVKVSS